MTTNKQSDHLRVDLKKKYDVLIVGGGMVGSTIACGLGRQGLSVALFDTTELVPFSKNALPELRVSALSVASEKILQNLGVWSHMEAMRMTPYRRMAVWEKLRSLYGKKINTNANRVVFDSKYSDRPQLGFIVENNVTQNSLLKVIKANPLIDFICPVTIKKINTSPDKTMIELSDGRCFFGNVIVGADGANSQVRQAAGIIMKQSDYDQQCLVATVEIMGGCQDITWQAFTPTGPKAFLPLPDIGSKSYGSIVWYNSPEKIRYLLSISDQLFIKELVQTFPQELPEIIQLHERGSFPLSRQHAKNYFIPGVVLAGDAAHTINPLAGQGVNIGLLDAAWLIEVLVKAHQAGKHLGCPSILARYEDLRRKDNTIMMNTMDAFYHMFSNKNKPMLLFRNLALAIVGKLPPVINQVMKYAMGTTGKKPELAITARAHSHHAKSNKEY